MTQSTIAKKRNARVRRMRSARRRLVRDSAGWLRLAASPTFALMAWVSAAGTPQITLCSHVAGVLPIDDMAWMYVLMSLFHLSPWLELASGRERRLDYPQDGN